jgi:hypothetical protein
VIATARKPVQLVGLKGRYSERVRTVALDVTNEAQAKAAFEAAITSFEGLDVLVNNAGYGYVCPVEDTPLAEFRAQIETNLFGVIIMNLEVFVQTLPGPPLNSVKAAQSMTPPSVRPFASRKAITGHSRGIRRRQQRCFSTLPRSPSRPCGCCSGAILTQQPRRALLIESSQTGTGRILAPRLTFRPTRHPSKNPVNS